MDKESELERQIKNIGLAKDNRMKLHAHSNNALKSFVRYLFHQLHFKGISVSDSDIKMYHYFYNKSGQRIIRSQFPKDAMFLETNRSFLSNKLYGLDSQCFNQNQNIYIDDLKVYRGDWYQYKIVVNNPFTEKETIKKFVDDLVSVIVENCKI